jgi:flagellum-specific peptidoglycan hydrolase FlgJ
MRALSRTTLFCLVTAVLGTIVAVSVATAAAAYGAKSGRSPVVLTDAQESFLTEATALARANQRRFGVPASVTIAQAILESGWGRSALVRTANNYFGMTCAHDDHGPVAAGCRPGTDRVCDRTGCRASVANFRAYRSIRESFTDHGRQFVVSPRYATAYAHRADPNRFVAEIHRAGYATDPRYTSLIRKIMKKYNLYRNNSG